MRVNRGLLMKDKLPFLVSSGLAFLFLTTFLCSSILTPSSTYADNEPLARKAVDVNLSVQPIIAIRTLDSTGETAASSVPLSILPTSNGAFSKNSFTLQVDTNNQVGYDLLMSSDYKTDGTTSESIPPTEAEYTNALVNLTTSSSTSSGTNNQGNSTSTLTLTDSIPTLSTPVTEADFSAPNSSYQNKWGVSSSYNETIAGESHTGGDLSLYNPVPNHSNTTTIRNDVDTPASNSRTTIGVAANANTEKTSGSYHNRLVFTAVANATPPLCTANHICYKANATGVDGTMDDQGVEYLTPTTNAGAGSTSTYSLSSSAEGFTFYSPNFARPGFGFAGWNTEPDGSGTMYGPNQTLVASRSSESVDQGGTSPVTLTPEMQAKLGSEGLTLYAQWIPSAGDMQNWTGCSNLKIGEVTALTDTREDNINLNPTYAVAKLADGKCWMIENLRYTGVGESSNSFGKDSSYNTVKQYNFTNISLADSTKSPTIRSQTGRRWYSYGNYYSWAAAIDSTTAYNSNNVPALGICPIGWRVPTTDRGTNNDYGYLYFLAGNEENFATSNKLRTYPNNFILAGSWSGSSASARGTSGFYWSSTTYFDNASYYIYLTNTAVYQPGQAAKYNGLSVRCVVDS